MWPASGTRHRHRGAQTLLRHVLVQQFTDRSHRWLLLQVPRSKLVPELLLGMLCRRTRYRTRQASFLHS